jgi:hypothetical protein
MRALSLADVRAIAARPSLPNLLRGYDIGVVPDAGQGLRIRQSYWAGHDRPLPRDELRFFRLRFFRLAVMRDDCGTTGKNPSPFCRLDDR